MTIVPLSTTSFKENCGKVCAILSKKKSLILGDVERYESPGTKFNVSGWGHMEYEAESQPAILNVVIVPWVSDSDCEAMCPSWIFTPQMICAGDIPEGGNSNVLQLNK